MRGPELPGLLWRWDSLAMTALAVPAAALHAALLAGGVGLALVLLGVLAAVVMMLVGLFPPLPRDLGGAPNLDGAARQVRIPLEDGDAIDGWLLPPRERAVALVLHGYGRDHSRAWRYGAFLHGAGYGVLAVNFRSSRWNRRLPTTLGHHEVVDAQAALDWLRGDPAFAGYRIGLLGESLGASVALIVAAANPEVAAVVADGPFVHASLALEDSSERWARLPRRSAHLARALGRVVTGRDLGEVDVEPAAAALCGRPLFLIHALEDNRLSRDHSRRLWLAAGAKDPLWLIPRAGHNEGWQRHRAEYERRVLAFFDRHLLERGEGLPTGESVWPAVDRLAASAKARPAAWRTAG
jgi:dipeptidyl aminopeptidase/acylaminoacyl peptidase